VAGLRVHDGTHGAIVTTTNAMAQGATKGQQLGLRLRLGCR
jgi:hypothetical protein